MVIWSTTLQALGRSLSLYITLSESDPDEEEAEEAAEEAEPEEHEVVSDSSLSEAPEQVLGFRSQ